MKIVTVILPAHQRAHDDIQIIPALGIDPQQEVEVRDREPEDAVFFQDSKPFRQNSRHLRVGEMLEAMARINQVDGFVGKRFEPINSRNVMQMGRGTRVDINEGRMVDRPAAQVQISFPVGKFGKGGTAERKQRPGNAIANRLRRSPATVAPPLPGAAMTIAKGERKFFNDRL